MKESEITALAREYAEEIYSGSAEFIDEVEQVICWLSQRFYLVEKSKIQEEYHEANICRTHFERYGAQWGALTAKMAILERFFPDLGKEVEG